MKIEAMDIRPARIEDVPQIANVHVHSWQGAYLGLLPQAYLDSLDPAQRVGMWTRALSETDWSHGGTLVAATDGNLLGFVSYGPLAMARPIQSESGKSSPYTYCLPPGAKGPASNSWTPRSGILLKLVLVRQLYGCSILMLERAVSMRRGVGSPMER